MAAGNKITDFRYSIEELTGAVMEILEERKDDSVVNTVLESYAIVGILNMAAARVRRSERRAFWRVDHREWKKRRINLGILTVEAAKYAGIKISELEDFERGSPGSMLPFQPLCYLWDLYFRFEGSPPDLKYMKVKRSPEVKVTDENRTFADIKTAFKRKKPERGKKFAVGSR